MVRSERTLLEQRLDRQLEYETGRQLGTSSREELEEALFIARERYETVCQEHQSRVQELNRAHAAQCDQLCGEIVQANRETVRLQRRLAAMTGGTSPAAAGGGWEMDMVGPPYALRSPAGKANVGGSAGGNMTANARAKQISRHRTGLLLMAILICTLAIAGQSGYLSFENEMTLRRLEFQGMQEMGERVSFLKRKWRAFLDAVANEGVPPQKMRNHIHPMVSKKHNVPSIVAFSAKKSEAITVPVVVVDTPGGGNTVDTVEENVQERKTSGGGLFAGIHDTIAKVGRLLKRIFNLLSSFFRRLKGKEKKYDGHFLNMERRRQSYRTMYR